MMVGGFWCGVVEGGWLGGGCGAVPEFLLPQATKFLGFFDC